MISILIRLLLGSVLLVGASFLGAAEENEYNGCFQANNTQTTVDKSAEYSYGFTESEKKLIEDKTKSILDFVALGTSPEIVFKDYGGFTVVPSCSGNETGNYLVLGPDTVDKLQGLSRYSTDLILAHEIAHLMQLEASPELKRALCRKEIRDRKTIELLADMVAGHIMYSLFEMKNRKQLLLVIAELSDYKFSDELHHGSMSERSNAFNMGQGLAARGKPLDVDKFLENKSVFLEVLGGAPRSSLGHNSYQEFYQNAMEALYR